MKFKAILISLVLIAPSAGVLAHSDDRVAKERAQKVERTVSTDAAVTVSLCVMSGNISVRGWDKNEVRARSNEAVQIEFRRKDGSSETAPATKLEVVILDKTNAQKRRRECPALTDVELDLPRGATVHVQTRDGDISISEIASAYAGTQNGDISIEGVTRTIEVGSIGGGIEIKNSSGRVNVSSVGGNVEAINLRPAERFDAFEVVSVSGDITLDQVTHRQLNVKTVNGNVNLTGPLATGGRYGFNTFSGDVTLTLPSESSFRLSAKVSQGGEVITDFPLTLVTEAATPAAAPVAPVSPVAPVLSGPPPAALKTPAPQLDPSPTPRAHPENTQVIKITPRFNAVVKVHPVMVQAPYVLRRINAVYGKGDATISVASFSGTLHLQKR
ncbi:MAG: DUF4097 family beta strand repeat-containing protein [Pyrinomonadaceae bacterium]